MNVLLDFLFQEFKGGQGRRYSSMNSLRSAISSVACIDGKPAGQHPLVCRFMKAVFNEKPVFPRYNLTWDPQLVLTHLAGLGPNKHLSLLQLSRKLVMLMLLQSGQRGQTLHLFDTRNMFFTPSRVTFTLGDPLKTSGPNSHISQITFKAYAPDRRLCVHTALVSYLQRTLDTRGKVTSLFLTTTVPRKAASRDTLRRWTRDLMGSAGVDLSIFSPHSTRSASSSTAAKYLPLSTIVKAIGWSKSSTFTTYYHKPIQDSRFADAVLASRALS